MTTNNPGDSRPKTHHRRTPETAPDPATPAVPDATEDTDALHAALAERDERYLRLAADFENFRRRKTQELADRSRYAAEDAARALLPVLDNLERAVDHASQDSGDEGFVDGLRLVARQFEEAMTSLGVTAIDAVGEPFDPRLHEAVTGEESDDVERDTVVAELQRGYRLHDRVIRPALVKVAHPAHPVRDPSAAQEN
jgi:molecular chaperone GrpE